MEKRNFVTSLRTSESSVSMDELVSSATGAFSDNTKQASAEEFEKKARIEDEKTDRL